MLAHTTETAREALLRLGLAGLSATLVVGLLALAPTPAQASTRHLHRVAYVLRHMKGTIITNRSIHAKTQIVGWTKITEHKYGTLWTPRVKTWRYCVKGRPCAGTRIHYMSGTMAGYRGLARMTYHWWNPFSWNWNRILSFAVHKVLAKCGRGALVGVVGVASLHLSARMLLKGGFIKRSVAKEVIGKAGWQGMAVVAVAGCVTGIVTQS